MSGPVKDAKVPGLSLDLSEVLDRPKKGCLWCGRRVQVKHWSIPVFAGGGATGGTAIAVGIVADAALTWGLGTTLVVVSGLGVYYVRKFKTRHTIAQNAQQILQTAQELEVTKGELAGAKGELLEKAGALEAVQKKLEEVSSQLLSTQVRFERTEEELQQSNQALQQKLVSLQGQIDAMKKLTEQLGKEICSAETAAGMLDQAVDQVDEKTDDLEGIVSQLGNRIKVLAQTYQKVKVEREELSSEVERLKKEREGLEGQVSELHEIRVHFQESQTALEIQAARLRQAEEEFAATQEELARLKQAFTNMERDLSVSVERVSTLTGLLQQGNASRNLLVAVKRLHRTIADWDQSTQPEVLRPLLQELLQRLETGGES